MTAGAFLHPPVRTAGAGGATILIDLSDLVYYLGHHDNLSGIQRVQSSVVLAMLRGGARSSASLAFIAYGAARRAWTIIPVAFLGALLEDLLHPAPLRRVAFSAQEAREGLLPGATALEGAGVIDPAIPTVLCLLGAAWVQPDYFRRVSALKRQYGARFVMLVHDLIPIFARDTCDPGTARVFEAFFKRARRHVDRYLCVSQHTARDLHAYLAATRAPLAPVTVTRLGSSFAEFAKPPGAGALDGLAVPERFVLFVSTIEGRKNHKLILDVWRGLLARGDDPPALLCVGRPGWKAQAFLSELERTAYLEGRVVLLENVSDEQLQALYARCLFTVFPSLYEGWGLPVGESLAAGRVCVCSARASIPEVAGALGVYVDIDDIENCRETIGRFIKDEAHRREWEARIARDYRPLSWNAAAAVVTHVCLEASRTPGPYRVAALPYAYEIGFSTLPPEGGSPDLLAPTDPRRPHILSAPLDEAAILLGEDVRAAGVWGEPEAWGVWMCEASGEIEVELGPNASRYYYLHLRLRVAQPAAQARVRLRVEGAPLWDGALGAGSRTIVLRVARPTGDGASDIISDTASEWRLRLRAEIDLAPEVRARIAGIDARIPTLGFERMAVIPESDVNARREAAGRM